MRVIFAIVTAAFAASLVTSTPSVAAPNRNAMTASYNACVSLARQRGWSYSDIYSNRDAGRDFVLDCMKGGEARAQGTKQQPAKAR